jgi:hypothetical protein
MRNANRAMQTAISPAAQLQIKAIYRLATTA